MFNKIKLPKFKPVDKFLSDIDKHLNGAVAPDYVFEWYTEGTSTLKPTYQLLSLAALEEFVTKHKHLPNVPSASTLEKEGLSLKEMNLLLLEKVEELTLYTLQQQKEINGLKEKIQAIEH